MKGPFLRTAYNYDRNAASDESGIDCQQVVDPETGELVATPSMAKQSFAEECDINVIVKRFGLSGNLPVGVRMPTFGDFEDVPTYHEAMNAIRAADEAFLSMPAEVRARFGNDPGAFVEFCSLDSNREEAVRLGLVEPSRATVAAPVATVVVDTSPGGPPVVSGVPAASGAAPAPVKPGPAQ